MRLLNNVITKLSIVIVFLITITIVKAQPTPQTKNKIIDEVVAVVGNIPILYSDIKNLQSQSKTDGENVKTECEALEDLMFQKLLVNQGQLDSVEVTDAQVEQELNKRLTYYVGQFGSEEKLEEFYGKSISAIKDEFRGLIKDQLMAQAVQGKIVSGLTISPAEVRAYFNAIPTDSLPLINSEIEIEQLVKVPPISAEEKQYFKDKINAIRERIVKGEDFATLAVLYSEDPGSAVNGGELGFLQRGRLVPEFEAAAFELKGKEISPIIESQFGFHIVQLIERRGEMINVRHILLSPKVSNADMFKAQLQLDSIYDLLKSRDTLSFEKAVLMYSNDSETKYNKGLLVNPSTGTTRFETDEIDQQLFFTIDKLKVGEFSRPVSFQSQDGKRGYRILYLRTKTDPHRSSLKEDYQRIQNVALMEKQSKAISTWITKKKNTTFISVDDQFKSCKFKNVWF